MAESVNPAAIVILGASALATGVGMLLVLRFLVGLGLGAIGLTAWLSGYEAETLAVILAVGGAMLVWLWFPLWWAALVIGAVLAATDFVMPGIEIIDSRYRDFKFDLKSVIADNCSSSRFVLGGQAVPVDELDLRTLGVVMEKNGEIVGIGAGAAVLGHPAAAIAMLANHLGARGEEIPAGTMILSGGVTEAVAVKAGDNVNLRIQSLGSTSVRFI